MVYLGPIEPRVAKIKNPNSPSEVRAVAASNAAHRVEEDEPVPEYGQPGFVERRRGDRRQKSKNLMVETRTGKDRRKSRRINISI